MTPEPAPITGQENRQGLAAPIRALSEFYAAFNGRDLEKMAAYWAATGDIVMANPVGGIKRGWDEISAVYAGIFNSPARVRVEFYGYTLHQTPELFYAVGKERGEFRPGRCGHPAIHPDHPPLPAAGRALAPGASPRLLRLSGITGPLPGSCSSLKPCGL